MEQTLRKGTANRRPKKSHCADTEKDSGFSDTSSDYFSSGLGFHGGPDHRAMRMTDAKSDEPTRVGSTAAPTRGSSSVPIQVSASFASVLQPIYIVKLNQAVPGLSAPPVYQACWPQNIPVPTPAHHQLVLLQPPAVPAAIAQQGVNTQVAPKPRQKPYPRIAPHPGSSCDSAGDRGSSASAHVLGKIRSGSKDSTGRSCKRKRRAVDARRNVERARSASHRIRTPVLLQKNQQTSSNPALAPKLASPLWCRPSVDKSLPPTKQTEQDVQVNTSASFQDSGIFSVCLSTDRAATLPTNDAFHKPAIPEAKTTPSYSTGQQPQTSQQELRFHNTVEVLTRCGLMEATLRMKRLLQMHAATQRQLESLREHTRLFCDAVKHQDNLGILNLKDTMTRSGAYPEMGAGLRQSPAACAQLGT
uniref:CLOCK-interacting pacemaker n=1 Tax=Myxine glutinosa TaxID=7769 RepID=UPI00358F8D71